MAKTFGGTIANLRKQAGISQRELALLASVSRNYIAKIENGIATNPSAVIVVQLANALRVPSDQLLRTLETEKENTTCQVHT